MLAARQLLTESEHSLNFVATSVGVILSRKRALSKEEGETVLKEAGLPIEMPPNHALAGPK